MSHKTTSGLILTAAKADITICEVFGDLPSGLIPVNGKPIIFYILQQMHDNGIQDIFIGVDYKKDELIEIVNLYFSTKLNIQYIFTDKNKAPGNSLLTLLKNVKSDNIIINLGDTYIKNFDLRSQRDVLVVSNDFLSEEKWATVKVQNNSIVKFNDKEKADNNDLYVICGLYIISDASILRKFKTNNNIQITHIIDFYLKYKVLNIVKTSEWLDFGHIDKYYISKKRLIQSREFNSLEFDDLFGTITKRSLNTEKFIAEIKWQLNLPKKLQALAPRVLDYEIGTNPYVTMEFYSYPTLAEIWLFSELNDKIYFTIIDKLFAILELFKRHQKVVLIDDYIDMYYIKTIKRLSDIDNGDLIRLMQTEYISINNKKLKNWILLKDEILKKIQNLYNENDNCFIHGDFCLSNILYDLRSGIVRLIDPRGIWGSTKNGDIKYDIAKLRHSICGDYDYIVNDLFKIDFVSISTADIKYTLFNADREAVKAYFDKRLEKVYDINQIKFIEGLLFLSMVSLHKDSHHRQLLMYLKAIELLNEVL